MQVIKFTVISEKREENFSFNLYLHTKNKLLFLFAIYLQYTIKPYKLFLL